MENSSRMQCKSCECGIRTYNDPSTSGMQAENHISSTRHNLPDPAQKEIIKNILN